MNKGFDLFKLSTEEDKHPRNWIGIKGEEIRKIINKIEEEIIKNQEYTREKLSRKLSKTFNCSCGVFKRILRGQTDYFPISFIKELVNISGNDRYLKEIHSKIEFLKVNSASSKEIIAVKRLDRNLAKIIGAFMADGSLTVTIIFASKCKKAFHKIESDLEKSNINYNEWNCKSRKEYNIGTTISNKNQDTINKLMRKNNKILNIQSHYNLEITDEHKSNIEAFREWMLDLFNILPTSFREKKGAWRLIYSNKIIARYFMCFFDVIPGPKTYTAFEPLIIKNSTFEKRKLFARGVLMFDGSFTSAGKLSFSTKSRYLFESIKEILNEDNIKIGTTSNRGSYIIFTYEKASKGKFLFYFEKRTIKWIKIKDFLETKNQSIGELNTRYKIYPLNKVTFERLYNLLRRIKSCDLGFLSEYFNCSRHIIKPYLIILRNSGLVELSNNPNSIKKEFVKSSTKVLLNQNIHEFIFKRLKEKYGTYKNFCNQTNIHKATVSAWKLRKNRIKLCSLEEICKLCNLDFSIVLNNIKEIDRNIVKVI